MGNTRNQYYNISTTVDESVKGVDAIQREDGNTLKYLNRFFPGKKYLNLNIKVSKTMEKVRKEVRSHIKRILAVINTKSELITLLRNKKYLSY